MLVLAILLVCSSTRTNAFQTPSLVIQKSSMSALDMTPVQAGWTAATIGDAQLSDTATLLLSVTEPWVQPAVTILDPFLNLMTVAMLARVVLSWYPATKSTEWPWPLVVFPTEPLLQAIKGIVPPAFGVDITPVVWLGIFTFVHEILLGHQGLLTMKLKYGI